MQPSRDIDMNELRRDPITGRWVVVFRKNIPEPSALKAAPIQKEGKNCPFCWGNEHMTPPEVLAFRKSGGSNTSGWTVRVVSNKYPALKIEGNLDKRGVGMFDMMNGIGAHEVIIDTPEHYCDMANYSYHQTEEAIHASISRSLDLRGDKRFEYILIFKNYGKTAGASLEHPHTQLIALPIVPKRVREELHGAASYYEYKERCVFCDIVSQTLEDKEGIIEENDDFLAFCPFVSRFPYEVWVLPKAHMSDFAYLPREKVAGLARVLRDSLHRIKGLLSDPPYNFIIHTTPIGGHEKEDYHWHIEIMPKLTKIAGFEWGSGFYVNPVPPHIAAGNLRTVKITK